MGFYDTSAWKRLRIAHLSAHPFCVSCLELDYRVPAVHVDHIQTVATAPELRLDPANLQSLCISCHSVKTQTEDKGSVARGCNLDGTPRDPNHHWNREKASTAPGEQE